MTKIRWIRSNAIAQCNKIFSDLDRFLPPLCRSPAVGGDASCRIKTDRKPKMFICQRRCIPEPKGAVLPRTLGRRRIESSKPRRGFTTQHWHDSSITSTISLSRSTSTNDEGNDEGCSPGARRFYRMAHTIRYCSMILCANASASAPSAPSATKPSLSMIKAGLATNGSLTQFTMPDGSPSQDILSK